MTSIIVTPWREGSELLRLRAWFFPASGSPDLRRKGCSQVSTHHDLDGILSMEHQLALSLEYGILGV